MLCDVSSRFCYALHGFSQTFLISRSICSFALSCSSSSAFKAEVLVDSWELSVIWRVENNSSQMKYSNLSLRSALKSVNDPPKKSVYCRRFMFVLWTIYMCLKAYCERYYTILPTLTKHKPKSNATISWAIKIPKPWNSYRFKLILTKRNRNLLHIIHVTLKNKINVFQTNWNHRQSWKCYLESKQHTFCDKSVSYLCNTSQ